MSNKATQQHNKETRECKRERAVLDLMKALSEFTTDLHDANDEEAHAQIQKTLT